MGSVYDIRKNIVGTNRQWATRTAEVGMAVMVVSPQLLVLCHGTNVRATCQSVSLYAKGLKVSEAN